MMLLTRLAFLLALAGVLFVQPPAAGRQGNSAAAAVCDRKGGSDHGTSADAAAERARRQTGGRVLSVHADSREGRPGYRVKVLTPDGQVRYVFVPSEAGDGRRD